MRIAAIAFLLGTLGLTACNSSNDAILAPNVLTGTFVLQTVNDVPLPATVVDSVNPPLRIEALAGTITINANGTFAETTTFRQTLSGVISTRIVTCSGTYRVVEATFEFSEKVDGTDCGRTFTGVVSGTALSASVLGVVAMFRTPLP
jgi:hypothetical protein